jgi:hypothetical protein
MFFPIRKDLVSTSQKTNLFPTAKSQRSILERETTAIAEI